MPRAVPRRRALRRNRGPVPTEPAAAYVEDEVDLTGQPEVEEAVEPEVDKDLPGPTPTPTQEIRESVVPGATLGTVAEVTVRVRPAREEPHSRVLVGIWATVVVAGLACLVAALVPVGPVYLDGIGAVAVVSAYAFALAARTGGRPVVFGGLALLLGVAVLVTDEDYLRTGAAVMTCVISALLGVMATVPAVRFLRVVWECCLAVVVAAIGALATVGFHPVIALMRFEYVTLGLALFGAFAVVYRLGAGLHGLGRRGMLAVLAGGAFLAALLLYAEMLRRYGSTDLVTSLLDGVRWSREHLGAFPRPIATVLGVPALAWGCHMRARRRQGWWLCAFGVAATAPVANSLVNPAISLVECALAVVYGLVVGLAIGYAVIRIDLAFTGSRGRGGRRLEQAGALRPEPPRTSALL